MDSRNAESRAKGLDKQTCAESQEMATVGRSLQKASWVRMRERTGERRGSAGSVRSPEAYKNGFPLIRDFPS